MKIRAKKTISFQGCKRSCFAALAVFFALYINGCSGDTATQPLPNISSSPLSVQVTPINVTLSAGISVQISAWVGNFIHDSTVTWSANVISASGQQLDSTFGSLSCAGAFAKYTSPKLLPSGVLSGANSFVIVIRVRSNEDTSKFANCTITVTGLQSGPSNITINPNAATLEVGQSQQFIAGVAGASNAGITWKLISGPGSISPTGFYTAPSSITGTSENATIEAMVNGDTAINAKVPVTVVPAPDPGPCFRTVIGAMIISNCSIVGCHNPTDMTDNLDFTTYSGLMKTVVAGDTGKSILWYRITHFANPLTAVQFGQISAWILAGAQNTQCQEPFSDCDTTGVTFSNFVGPTIKNYCVGCHSGRNVPICDGYDFSTYAGVFPAVARGQLLEVINNTDRTSHMPLNGPQLDSCTIAKITAWINQGAQNN